MSRSATKVESWGVIESVYSRAIISIQRVGNEQIPAKMRGIDAITRKNEWLYTNHGVHSGSAEVPCIAVSSSR